MRKNLLVGSLFLLFVFVFFEMKRSINQRNLENQYFLATVYRMDESVDHYSEDVYEKTHIQEPLSNQAFFQRVKELIAKNQHPQKIILMDVSNYQEERLGPTETLEQVMVTYSGKQVQLLLDRSYRLEEDLPVTQAPFDLISEGKLGLVSNTLEYRLAVTECEGPEEWISYLPVFVEQIQAVNQLPNTESVVYIETTSRQFVYRSKKKNQLTEIKRQDLE